MSAIKRIHIWRFPKPKDLTQLQIQAQATREIRLRSLKLDPEKFYSKHDDEVKQALDFFMGRLRPDWVEHFVATEVTDQTKLDQKGNPILDENSIFEAILVMINENAKEEEKRSGDNDPSAAQECLPTYSLAAIWVDPEHRGYKLGSRMISESLRWLREDALQRGWKRVLCQLAVKPSNEAAIRLYHRFGFEVVKGKSLELESTDEVNMAMVVNIEKAAT